MTWTFQHVSPSQIVTWLGCQRAWYWQYPMGFTPPTKPSALTGTACHAVIEDFIQDAGEDLTLRQDPKKDRYRTIVRPALPVLLDLRERYKSGAFVELEMKRPLRNGLVLKGRIDFLDLSARSPETNAPENLVVDHKSSSNIVQWAKTAEELRTDIQMLAYGYESLCRKPTPTVRLAHNVFQTRGIAAAQYTDVVVPAVEIHQGWTRINDISDKMIETSKLASPADVPETRTACDKYGGCAHRDRCAAIWSVKGGPALSPYAGIEAASTQENKENQVSNKPVVPALPPHLRQKLGIPDAAPAATPRANILPPEAPQDPRARAADAKALAAQAKPAQPAPAAVVAPPVQPAPAPAPAAPAAQPQVDGAALLLQLGWSGEEINAMSDEVFNKVVEGKWRRDLDGLYVAYGEPEQYTDENGKEKTYTPITNVVPPQPAPARPQRVARVATPAPAPAQPVAEVVATEPEVVAQPDPLVTEHGFEVTATPASTPARRRGRPPGAKNKATLEKEAAAQAPAEQNGTSVHIAQDPTVERIEAALDEAHGAEVDGDDEYLKNRDRATVPGTHEYELRVRDERIANLEKTLSETTAELQNYMLGKVKAENPNARFVLYVDCLPEFPDPTLRSLDVVLQPFMDLAAKNYKNEKTGAPEPLSHYALIPFGKGPGIVAGYVLTNLQHVVQPGALYVDTRSPCAAAVLEVLRPKADLVVSARGR